MAETMDNKHKLIMTRYLLGELSVEERVSLEEQYTVNLDLFEELVAVENDLVDSYANGKLTKVERKRFEDYYLTTAKRRRRVEFARSLVSYCSTMEPMGSAQDREAPRTRGRLSMTDFVSAHVRTTRAIAAVIFLAVIVSGLWIARVNRRLRHELGQLQVAQANLERQEQELRQQVAQLSLPPQQTAAVSGYKETGPRGVAIALLTLTPGLRSGDQQNTLTVPKGISAAHLRLKLNQREYMSYGVVLETVEGTRLWQKEGLKSQTTVAHEKALVVKLPSNILKNGDYILKLTGTAANRESEEVDAYTFRVLRR